MTEQQKKQIIIGRARDQVVHRLALYNECIRHSEIRARREVLFFLFLIGFFTLLFFIIFSTSINTMNDTFLMRLGVAFLCAFGLTMVFTVAGVDNDRVDDNQAATIYEKPELTGKYARLKSQPLISFECIIRDDTLLSTLYDELYTYKRVVDSEDLGILTISRLKTLSLATGNDKDTTVTL